MKTITMPELKAGETYAGILLNEDGTPSHHVILLPGDNDSADWQTQTDWAKSIGGELPSRQEQSLLYANCRQHFERDWYWAAEEHSSGSARSQYFGDGTQYHDRKHDELRARAVRRVEIEP